MTTPGPPLLPPIGRALITSFGLGFCRPASGTWGSLPPAAVGAALVLAGVNEPGPWLAVMAAFALVFSAACLRWGAGAEQTFGRKDPSQVVADETAGMGVTLLFFPLLPATSVIAAIAWLGVAFVLWRLADIVKPWPANRLQALPGGLGILIDDLLAALYAGVALVIAARIVG